MTKENLALLRTLHENVKTVMPLAIYKNHLQELT